MARAASARRRSLGERVAAKPARSGEAGARSGRALRRRG
ncbi:hypothetical protein BURPS406E_P0169 [Burkholderia pseudomallei 406e]|nr:hypothetical protein BPC006_II0306 [Burkholderia pseudomallei BPC006]EBA47865.1 hypothetical protein BURPS305_3452 [Burkholderia pseudomallei 305]EDK52699.1 hypothetical protein BMAFMH_G0121 [Burkholderia mallei FMH]EDO86737.1 hypothetical protein BURPS406E_P0169 [Burkholderia pseudomallei 406e]EEH29260.1 hypothetical protein BUH_4607 [Burkholderia pseudomallei Pakistan 9]